MKQYLEILDSISGYLKYQKSLKFEDISKKIADELLLKLKDIITINPHRTLSLEAIRKELGDCKRCRLHKSRKNLVFGEGDPNAGLVFIGEAPGEEEDIQGRPFVGKAGQLLTRIINAIELERKEVYICNIIKCRPPENRNPSPDEIKSCWPFLNKQLKAINPKLIVALGTFAAQTLLETTDTISKLRGKFYNYNNIKLMPTFHPAFLLRNPNMKRPVWEDMQKVQEEYKK